MYIIVLSIADIETSVITCRIHNKRNVMSNL